MFNNVGIWIEVNILLGHEIYLIPAFLSLLKLNLCKVFHPFICKWPNWVVVLFSQEYPLILFDRYLLYIIIFGSLINSNWTFEVKFNILIFSWNQSHIPSLIHLFRSELWQIIIDIGKLSAPICYKSYPNLSHWKFKEAIELFLILSHKVVQFAFINFDTILIFGAFQIYSMFLPKHFIFHLEGIYFLLFTFQKLTFYFFNILKHKYNPKCFKVGNEFLLYLVITFFTVNWKHSVFLFVFLSLFYWLCIVWWDLINDTGNSKMR